MIASIQGILKHVNAPTLIVETGGLGYAFLCPADVVEAAKNHLATTPERLFSLWCVSFIKDEAFISYGFDTLKTKELFLLLTQISGVGGRMGLNLLSELGPQGLLQATLQNDAKKLQKTEGVGPKMAARLLLELKNRQVQLAHCVEATGLQPVKTKAPLLTSALQALKNLGYREEETLPCLTDYLENHPDSSLENLLQQTLQQLSQAKRISS